MTTSLYRGAPATARLIASIDTVCDLDLDRWAGEDVDFLHNVITIEADATDVTITTTRSIEALHRGEPNAGRGTWTIPRTNLDRLYVGDKLVLGREP